MPQGFNASDSMHTMAGKAAVFRIQSLAVLFVVYSRYQNPEMIIPDAFDDIQSSIGFMIVCHDGRI